MFPQILLTLTASAAIALLVGGPTNLVSNSEDRIAQRQYYSPQRTSGQQVDFRRPSQRSNFQCEVDNDLIMVLDSSAGMRETDYRKAKEFLADFAAAFNSHRHNRLGLKVFAIQPQTIFELTNINTPSEMRTHILSAPYYGNASLNAYFHYALADSYSELKRLNRSIVDQNFVLITAGPSKEPSSIHVEAEKMIKAGVRNFAVGIGSRVVESQLLDITGKEPENVFLAPDFDGLKGILDELIQLVCSDKAPVCHKENDLMITLDDSASVAPSDFQIGKEFVAKLVDSFVMSEHNRVSFRIFSATDKSIFNLNNTLTRAQVQAAVLNTATRRGSYTNTHLTLNAGVEEFHRLGRKIPQNFLVITDGRSSNRAETEKAAKAAKAAGINTFAVGIGQVNEAELLIIANGDRKRMFKVNDFEQLEEILKELSGVICDKQRKY